MLPSSLKKRNLDIGVFPAFFGQDLDAEIDVFVSGVSTVIAINLTIENDGGRSRSLGLAGHLQFFGRHGLETHRPG